MAFSIKINQEDIFPIITLTDIEKDTQAEIYSFGALLNSFTIINGDKTANVIAGFRSPADAKENITAGFKSAHLSPFVCRVKNGTYVFNGETHTIKKFYLGTEAIHGLLFDAPFKIINTYADAQNASVLLRYEYTKGNEGYPFKYLSQIVYTLNKDNTLNIETCIKNIDDKPIPVSDGWHPYFKLGESINDLLVQFNTNTMLEFNANLLPTGNTIPFTSFETAQLLNDTSLDNCFVLKDHIAPACVLKDSNSNLQLIIKAGESYPYLQVYTPDDRKSIAIENLSSAPDSFNNDIGLLIVKPGEQYSFATSYQINAL